MEETLGRALDEKSLSQDGHTGSIRCVYKKEQHSTITVWTVYMMQSGSNTCRLTGDSKSLAGVNVSVSGCLSLRVGPVMNW